jgi:hypothetical protein
MMYYRAVEPDGTLAVSDCKSLWQSVLAQHTRLRIVRLFYRSDYAATMYDESFVGRFSTTCLKDCKEYVSITGVSFVPL